MGLFHIVDRYGNIIDRTTDYGLARQIAAHYGAIVRIVSAEQWAQ